MKEENQNKQKINKLLGSMPTDTERNRHYSNLRYVMVIAGVYLGKKLK